MTPETEKRQLGEYRLRELRGENTLCWTWLAEQVSVSRLVLVDELRTEESGKSAAFLANCRAKASVEHPLIGSVFEAVAEPGLCFYAHELLAGTTLAERGKLGRPLKASRLAVILRRVSDANLKHESLNRATSPLRLEDIHLEEHGVIRLKNLAVAGPRTPDQSPRDIAYLGELLVPFVAADRSGLNRFLTLLGWMRGDGLDSPITWPQVRGYCLEIERQLADFPLSPPTQKGLITQKAHPITWIVLGTVVALCGILAFALKIGRPTASRPPLPEAVQISAGEYLTPDSTTAALAAFRISATEVTIGQYAVFLEAVAASKRKNSFGEIDQPKEKTSHLPDDWPALLAAAEKNGTWQNQSITLDSPVIGVDWWDAAAYADWQNARLPSQEEWFAGLHSDEKTTPAIPPGAYLPVTSQKEDRTSHGLIGMAGSVSEWIGKPVQNPANPFGEKVWVIIGGSFLHPGNGVHEREWLSDRSLRRPDLGFRVVFDEK